MSVLAFGRPSKIGYIAHRDLAADLGVYVCQVDQQLQPLPGNPSLTASQASHYYRSEFSRGDYYTQRESEGVVHSRWHGRGAEQLSLSGRVKADVFSHLLEGHDPSGEHVLVPHREGLSERRAGWDVTISPHKSVSLAALVGGDERLLDAHDRALDKALSELERHAQAWVHGGRDVETTGVVVAASFRHETSRALDPQLHSHDLDAIRRALSRFVERAVPVIEAPVRVPYSGRER